MTHKAVHLRDSARRVLISRNPSAGARSRLHQVDALVGQLRAGGHEVQVLTDLGELASLAAELHERQQLRAVVAAGGDGTVAEIVNRTARDTPIALLPLGNENLLAKYLGSATTPAEVVSTIEGGLTIQLDAGRAGSRVFLLMISAGFDAEVVRQVDEARTGHISQWTYAKPILRAIRSYQYPEIRLYCRVEAADPASTDLKSSDRRLITARWAMVVNLPRYARGLNFAPRSVGTDGLLDVCTFKRGSLPSGLWYLGNVLLGRHGRLADCTMMNCEALRIESDEPVPYQLDGDPGGLLPVDVEVLPERLRLVVTPAAARACGFQLPNA